MAEGEDATSPYGHVLKTLTVQQLDYEYYDVASLNATRYASLPYCIRVLLEAAVRLCDGFHVTSVDVDRLLEWQNTTKSADDGTGEVAFKPARVVFQDFTGLPAMLDLAAMREALVNLGREPTLANPACATDLILDCAIQVDGGRSVPRSAPSPDVSSSQKTCVGEGQGRPPCNTFTIASAPVVDDMCPFHCLPTDGAGILQRNQELEFERSKERLVFLKWAAEQFSGVRLVAPQSSPLHQVAMESLAHLVCHRGRVLYPDSIVGTDTHIAMNNGLGILSLSLGAVETEAAMLGQATSLVLPAVVGYRISGSLSPLATSTDLVLAITKHLKQVGVAGKFVEFFGSGVAQLSIADRTTIANMCPEYGAVVGYFPVDDVTLRYLHDMGRDQSELCLIETYLRVTRLLADHTSDVMTPAYCQVVELDLSSVVVCCSGPVRPQDKVAVCDVKSEFVKFLKADAMCKLDPLVSPDVSSVPFIFSGAQCHVRHGDVVLAAIAGCTNATNPSVMLAAGLLAKKAVERGLSVRPYLKTCISPGQGLVTHYLTQSGLIHHLQQLGFAVVGYGCKGCSSNNTAMNDCLVDAVHKGHVVAVGVLSGNRNTEGRVHTVTRASYLASPLLVISYALAGSVLVDFETEPLGSSADNQPVFLRDIWPTREEISDAESRLVIPPLFKRISANNQTGIDQWNKLETPSGATFPWSSSSTYIRCPPFFRQTTPEVPPVCSIIDARVLLHLGDSVTTDHISPAGSIARNTPAGRYLSSMGLAPREFNSYGSRRGNDAVMARNTFANIRLENKLIGRAGPKTVHFPTNDVLDVFDVAERYREEGRDVIVLAGKQYGCGSSRDWAAKGPSLLGVRAVLAESFDPAHRSSLLGVGILPLQYQPGQNSKSLGLTGREMYSITLPSDLNVGQLFTVKPSPGTAFEAIARLDSVVELTLYRHGGTLNYALHRFLDTNHSQLVT